jgi:hypothetical protein
MISHRLDVTYCFHFMIQRLTNGDTTYCSVYPDATKHNTTIVTLSHNEVTLSREHSPHDDTIHSMNNNDTFATVQRVVRFIYYCGCGLRRTGSPSPMTRVHLGKGGVLVTASVSGVIRIGILTWEPGLTPQPMGDKYRWKKLGVGVVPV